MLGFDHWWLQGVKTSHGSSSGVLCCILDNTANMQHTGEVEVLWFASARQACWQLEKDGVLIVHSTNRFLQGMEEYLNTYQKFLSRTVTDKAEFLHIPTYNYYYSNGWNVIGNPLLARRCGKRATPGSRCTHSRTGCAGGLFVRSAMRRVTLLGLSGRTCPYFKSVSTRMQTITKNYVYRG